MPALKDLWNVAGVAPALDEAAAAKLAAELSAVAGEGAGVYPASLTVADGTLFFLLRRGLEKRLGLFARNEKGKAVAGRFDGPRRAATVAGEGGELTEAPTTNEASVLVRELLPFTAPRSLGTAPAVGFGDRLGLATPGHVRAVQKFGRGKLAPVFAQQSARELARTEREPEDVTAAATWGVLETGFRDGCGADADHLKSTDDLDRFQRAGFTFFTIDPGDHVRDVAGLDAAALERGFAALPWSELDSSDEDCLRRYADKEIILSDGPLPLSREALLRAAVKYGGATAHTAKLYRYLQEISSGVPFEVEMSVDETETPTSVEEHAFIAAELERLGVKLVSLAPRFVGRFEKGVDYQGDVGEFERTFRRHVAVAERFGGYKIGIHSGSDKFTIYPIASRLAGGAVHVKTAGTSYLEALRVAALKEPPFFREILAFARERYETDKATYHVSAKLEKVPPADAPRDDELPALLDAFDTRQALHVTFGSVLTQRAADGKYVFKDRLLTLLKTREEDHYACLEKHLGRHVALLVGEAD